MRYSIIKKEYRKVISNSNDFPVLLFGVLLFCLLLRLPIEKPDAGNLQVI